MSETPLSPRSHDEVTKRREAETERDQLKAENARYLKAIKELRLSNASLQKQLKDLSSSVEEALVKKQSGSGGASGGNSGADAEITKRDGIIKSLQRQLFTTRKNAKELESKLETYQQSGYIADLQSQLKLKTQQVEELKGERKTLEKLQRQKDKALVKLESDRDLGPAAVRRFEEDIRSLKHQLREHQEAKLEYERVIAQKQQMLDRHFRLFGAVHDELLKKSKLNKELDENDVNSVVKTFLSYDRDIARISEMIESKDNIIVEKTRVIETLEKNYAILEKARETDQRLRMQEASRMMRALEDDSHELHKREEVFTEREKELRYAVATLKSRNRQLEAAIQQLTDIDPNSPHKEPVNLKALAAGRIDDLPLPSPRLSSSTTPRGYYRSPSTRRSTGGSGRKSRSPDGAESLREKLSRTPAAKNPTRIPMLRNSPHPLVQSPDDDGRDERMSSGDEGSINGTGDYTGDYSGDYDNYDGVDHGDGGHDSLAQDVDDGTVPAHIDSPASQGQGNSGGYAENGYAVDEPDDVASPGLEGAHARNIQNAIPIQVEQAQQQQHHQQQQQHQQPQPAQRQGYQRSRQYTAPVQNPAVQRAGSAGQHARSHSHIPGQAPLQRQAPPQQQYVPDGRRISGSHPQAMNRAPSPAFGYEPQSAPRGYGYGQAPPGQAYGGGYVPAGYGQPGYGQGPPPPQQQVHRSSSAGTAPVWQPQPYSSGRHSVGRR